LGEAATLQRGAVIGVLVGSTKLGESSETSGVVPETDAGTIGTTAVHCARVAAVGNASGVCAAVAPDY